MRIITPNTIEQVAWEGDLIPLEKRYLAEVSGRLTLGEPTWWSPEQAMEVETAKKWAPPATDHNYRLVRLACNLHPPSHPRAHYKEAFLTVRLASRHGNKQSVAHDLFPQRTTVSEKRMFGLKLSPEVKIAEVADLKLLEADVGIEYEQVYPVIQGFGLGESKPYWRFGDRPGSPLLGCQSVYFVMAAPQESDGVLLILEFTATMETRYGPIKLGLPEPMRAPGINWLIPL